MRGGSGKTSRRGGARWLVPRPHGAVAMLGVVAVLGATLLTGCGGQSVPAPVPVQQLLTDALTSGGGTGRLVSLITATGTGSRAFSPRLPRSIRVELSCRGGRSVDARINGRAWLTVYCGSGMAGGDRERFDRRPRLSLVATRRTRWSLVVATLAH